MNARALFLVVAAGLLGACTAQPYQPKSNEEIYGTWIADKAAQQKLVIAAGELRNFTLADDTQPYNACTQVITARWKDPEGTLWYKTCQTITGGLGGLKGTKWQSLNRLSKAGSVLETMAAPVRDFDPKAYPEKLDPASESYAVFHRSIEASLPRGVLFGDDWR